MNKISTNHISLAYGLAKELYQKRITKQDAIDKVKENGMNVGSAIIYFVIFKHLLSGESFSRTINAESFDYFLDKIYLDFGIEKLKIALSALKQHIEYFENIQNTQMKKVRLIHEKFCNQHFDANIVEEDDETSFPEGREKYLLHKTKERNKELIKLAKEQYLKTDQKLRCQVCGFSFIDNYGEIGQGFIEAHHIYPISQLAKETETKIEDIALVCSNCHRMLHRRRPWLTVGNLEIMQKNRNLNVNN